MYDQGSRGDLQMPDLKPFIVLGLALGGVFALSGVGLVVLFRATGVAQPRLWRGRCLRAR